MQPGYTTPPLTSLLPSLFPLTGRGAQTDSGEPLLWQLPPKRRTKGQPDICQWPPQSDRAGQEPIRWDAAAAGIPVPGAGVCGLTAARRGTSVVYPRHTHPGSNVFVGDNARVKHEPHIFSRLLTKPFFAHAGSVRECLCCCVISSGPELCSRLGESCPLSIYPYCPLITR